MRGRPFQKGTLRPVILGRVGYQAQQTNKKFQAKPVKERRAKKGQAEP